MKSNRRYIETVTKAQTQTCEEMMIHIAHIVLGIRVGPALHKQTHAVSVTPLSGQNQSSISALYWDRNGTNTAADYYLTLKSAYNRRKIYIVKKRPQDKQIISQLQVVNGTRSDQSANKTSKCQSKNENNHEFNSFRNT